MKRTFKYLVAFTFCSFMFCIAKAQPTMGNGNRQGGKGFGGNMNIGHFYGKFIDSKTGKPIEGASIVLRGNKFDTATKKMKEVILKTIISANNGDFSLENLPVMGNFKMKVSAIGYKTLDRVLKFDIKLQQGESGGADMAQKIAGMTDVDLGNIKLEATSNDLGNVTVTTSKQLFELGIDRKIFNVDKNLVSSGQTAVEVMKTIPSVSVDIDGNVTMRNAAPQIFVDGRPTTLTLDQIPSDIIDKIEIITNPSAKFDASGGNAGIINVVLKKNKKNGYNGNIRTGLDSRGKANLGADISYRENKVNFFGSANFNQRKSISTAYTSSIFNTNPTTTVISNNDGINNGYFGFFRGGLDYFVDNRNTISVAASYHKGSFDNEGQQKIDTSTTSLISKTNRNTTSEFTMQNFGAQLSYKHNFAKNGNSISADVNFNSSKNNSLSNINSLVYNSSGAIKYPLYLQQGTGAGTNKFVTTQLDYENILKNEVKVEAGVRAAFRNFTTENLQYLNPTNTSYTLNTKSSTKYKFNDQVLAAYNTYSFKHKKFSYQFGLRVESSTYTGTLQTLKGTDSSSFKIDYPISLFPSAFITYKLADKQDFQLNFSRRINRPNFFQLLPAYDFSDPQNPNVGNPNLKPEFTNSFEISYNNAYKKNANFLATVYFKHSTNLITRYIYKDVNKNVEGSTTDSLYYTSFINANTSYTYGLELTNKMPVTTWWDLTLNVNVFNANINATIPGQSVDNSIVSWTAKFNNTIKLGKGFTIQFSGDNRSKVLLPTSGGGMGGQGGGGRGGGMFMGGGQQTLAQGYTLPRYFDCDLAIRKDWTWKNGQSGSLTLSMNDIFYTKLQTYSQAIYFTQESYRRRDPQVLRLMFSYRFGKMDVSLFKRKNTKADQGGGTDMGGGMGQ